MTDNYRNRARSFLSAGINLLQQVSQKGDSSDDDFAEVNENQDFINNGQRGIIVFKTYSVKTDRQKVIHVNLYKAVVTQYYDAVKRSFSCDEVLSITRNSDNHVVVEIKRPMAIQIQEKKIIFESEQMAYQFHQYIEFINESGACVKAAFQAIDYRRTGRISAEELKKALASVDLRATDQDIQNMLALGAAENGVFDFHDFFHLFLNSFVSNLRQCLQEWLIRSADDEHPELTRVDTNLDCLPGEVIAFAPSEKVHWCVFGGKTCKFPQCIPGVMYATNYRVVLMSLRKSPVHQIDHSRFDVPPFFNMISVPLTSLLKIYTAPPRNSIYMVCKDYRTIRVTLSGFENSKNKVETFVQVLQGIAYYNQHSMDPKTHLFCYKNCTYLRQNEEGWNLCDMIKEYVRQGLYDLPEWKVLENKEYSLADTYPRYLAFPAAMTKAEINIAAGFRSKRRLPVVTYLHKSSGAVLTRSAQPLVGLVQKNCPEDEKLLNFYRCKGKRLVDGSDEDMYSKLYIMDARGKVAATLNMAVGKGTEDPTLYKRSELIFCNIDNIHIMRTSANVFAEALANQTSLTASKDAAAQLLEGSFGGYFGKLEESNWLKHIRLIIIAGIVTAEKLHFEGASVLIHCSDGWDRTAQICSLTQVMLDPYFRSLDGISVLIEKEWCSFGHKFQDRCGHGMDVTQSPDERSPIFLQFLDVLYQLIVQFPNVFEYTEMFLLFLADHVYSCAFGNFLGNCQRERVEDYEAPTLTKSIWAYVFEHRDAFVNTNYVDYPQPIWPATGPASMRVWSRYWLRWDPTAHPNALSSTPPWHDDWGKGAETDPRVTQTRSSYSFVPKPAAGAVVGSMTGGTGAGAVGAGGSRSSSRIDPKRLSSVRYSPKPDVEIMADTALAAPAATEPVDAVAGGSDATSSAIASSVTTTATVNGGDDAETAPPPPVDSQLPPSPPESSGASPSFSLNIRPVSNLSAPPCPVPTPLIPIPLSAAAAVEAPAEGVDGVDGVDRGAAGEVESEVPSSGESVHKEEIGTKEEKEKEKVEETGEEGEGEGGGGGRNIKDDLQASRRRSSTGQEKDGSGRKKMLKMELKFSGGADRITVYYGDDPMELAKDFVSRHSLKEGATKHIAKSIETQIEAYLHKKQQQVAEEENAAQVGADNVTKEDVVPEDEEKKREDVGGNGGISTGDAGAVKEGGEGEEEAGSNSKTSSGSGSGDAASVDHGMKRTPSAVLLMTTAAQMKDGKASVTPNKDTPAVVDAAEKDAIDDKKKKKKNKKKKNKNNSQDGSPGASASNLTTTTATGGEDEAEEDVAEEVEDDEDEQDEDEVGKYLDDSPTGKVAKRMLLQNASSPLKKDVAFETGKNVAFI